MVLVEFLWLVRWSDRQFC